MGVDNGWFINRGKTPPPKKLQKDTPSHSTRQEGKKRGKRKKEWEREGEREREDWTEKTKGQRIIV